MAHVDVRSGSDNRSKAIEKKIKQYGGSVAENLQPGVTHVIWKEGKASLVERARKQNVPVVSVLWIDR